MKEKFSNAIFSVCNDLNVMWTRSIGSKSFSHLYLPCSAKFKLQWKGMFGIQKELRCLSFIIIKQHRFCTFVSCSVQFSSKRTIIKTESVSFVVPQPTFKLKFLLFLLWHELVQTSMSECIKDKLPDREWKMRL